jgi:hypothetical protein
MRQTNSLLEESLRSTTHEAFVLESVSSSEPADPTNRGKAVFEVADTISVRQNSQPSL